MGVVSVFISVVAIVEFHCEWGETQKLFLQITYIKGCQKWKILMAQILFS